MNRTPVVFIHGAWLHALSWESWADRFAGRGFLTCAPGWPGETHTVDARTSPEVLGGVGLDALTDRYAGIARSFDISERTNCWAWSSSPACPAMNAASPSSLDRSS
ncbi:hypothetical protein ACWD4J_41035 [Streptomyces sp. NPDC002577]